MGIDAVEWAVRFLQSFPQVTTVLSGASTLEQMKQNIELSSEQKPLDERELSTLQEVAKVLADGSVPCTACHYCTERCPRGIDIPALFACMNRRKVFHNWNSVYYYQDVLTGEGTKASDCLKCGRCEEICPQHLKIRELLEEVAGEFEKEDA